MSKDIFNDFIKFRIKKDEKSLLKDYCKKVEKTASDVFREEVIKKIKKKK